MGQADFAKGYLGVLNFSAEMVADRICTHMHKHDHTLDLPTAQAITSLPAATKKVIATSTHCVSRAKPLNQFGREPDWWDS